MTMSGSRQSSLLFNTVTLRVTAPGEYLLPELGAGAAHCFFAGRDKTSSSDLGVELVIKRRKCAARRVWEYMLGLCTEKCDFGSASSLTWFGVVGPCTERCDVERGACSPWAEGGVVREGERRDACRSLHGSRRLSSVSIKFV